MRFRGPGQLCADPGAAPQIQRNAGTVGRSRTPMRGDKGRRGSHGADPGSDPIPASLPMRAPASPKRTRLPPIPALGGTTRKEARGIPRRAASLQPASVFLVSAAAAVARVDFSGSRRCALADLRGVVQHMERVVLLDRALEQVLSRPDGLDPEILTAVRLPSGIVHRRSPRLLVARTHDRPGMAVKRHARHPKRDKLHRSCDRSRSVRPSLLHARMSRAATVCAKPSRPPQG
jgi:hypothetical protein